MRRPGQLFDRTGDAGGGPTAQDDGKQQSCTCSQQRCRTNLIAKIGIDLARVADQENAEKLAAFAREWECMNQFAFAGAPLERCVLWVSAVLNTGDQRLEPRRIAECSSGCHEVIGGESLVAVFNILVQHYAHARR